LVIDDSRLWRHSLSTLLQRLGTTVVVAADGAEGLSLAVSGGFDLICLDLHLPDLDGRDICRRLRAAPQTILVPVVMLTADDDPKTLMECALAGATDVLRKRTIEEMSGVLQSFLRHARRSHEGAVLLVEDSPSAALVARRSLERMGLDVHHATDPHAALERFYNEDFDLVITDLVFASDLNGLGLVRAIRGANTHRRMCPILVVSAFDDAMRRIELFRHGADDYVIKPLLHEEFAARVGKLIDNKKLMDQVRVQQVALRRMAEFDALTGLLNRHALQPVVDRFVSAAQSGAHPLTLAMIDLDHFKAINDTWGHAVGDQVLTTVGAALQALCADGEIGARIGGEEFVMLLPGCSAARAGLRGEAIRRAIEIASEGPHPVTASVGVATFDPRTDTGWADLFKRADAAVYQSKLNGRNRVTVSLA
jgi:two-component system cell cycle response regulator